MPTGDDYCVDSDEETEECKQRDTEENCNLLCDTLVLYYVL